MFITPVAVFIRPCLYHWKQIQRRTKRDQSNKKNHQQASAVVVG